MHIIIFHFGWRELISLPSFKLGLMWTSETCESLFEAEVAIQTLWEILGPVFELKSCVFLVDRNV